MVVVVYLFGDVMGGNYRDVGHRDIGNRLNENGRPARRTSPGGKHGDMARRRHGQTSALRVRGKLPSRPVPYQPQQQKQRGVSVCLPIPETRTRLRLNGAATERTSKYRDRDRTAALVWF